VSGADARLLRPYRHRRQCKDFVDGLKKLLADTAAEIDKSYPENAGDFTINSNGEPTVRRGTAREVSASAIALQAAIEQDRPAQFARYPGQYRILDRIYA
jgi:hypothetical protein